MDPLSIERLRKNMAKQRKNRMYAAVGKIYYEIIEASNREESELIVRIIPRQIAHIMLNTIRLDEDIADEVYSHLQQFLGDILHTKTEYTIHFKW